MLPPGPPGRPLVGSLPEIRRDPLGFLARVSSEYGDIAHFRLGPYHAFLLNRPEDIERVLVTQQHRFEKGRTLDGARRLFGNGLLTSDGAHHVRQRRLVQPTFHRVRMDDYADAMTHLSAAWCDGLNEGCAVDIAAEMSRLTLAITGRIVFGADGDGVVAEIRDSLDTATGLLEVAVLPFAGLLDLLPSPRTRRFRAARATIDRVVNDVVERRRRSGRAHGDVVSLMIAAREGANDDGMSRIQLRDEIVTLLLASHETTANALAWTWYLLSLHGDVEARLRAELDAILGSDRRPTAADVPNLPFTRAVLAESMRLYPPAWLIARVAVEDHEACGFVIPAGALVVLSPWAVHRNSAWFARPEAFDPGRWCVEGQGSRPRFSYFPFGGGPRGCMGEAFAWMEGVLLLAVIARRWRFRLLDALASPRPHPGLTLTPKPGIRVRVERP